MATLNPTQFVELLESWLDFRYRIRKESCPSILSKRTYRGIDATGLNVCRDRLIGRVVWLLVLGVRGNPDFWSMLVAVVCMVTFGSPDGHRLALRCSRVNHARGFHETSTCFGSSSLEKGVLQSINTRWLIIGRGIWLMTDGRRLEPDYGEAYWR